jgi:hypothetical protein
MRKAGSTARSFHYIMVDDQYKPDVGLRVFEELMSIYRPLCVFSSGTPVALAVPKAELLGWRAALRLAEDFSQRFQESGLLFVGVSC